MRFSRLASLVSVVALTAACSNTLPPKELVDARAAFASASKGPASTQAPAELHVAKQALDQAERAFSDEPDAAETKDYAYIATRKSELADATARQLIAQKEKEAADRDAANLQADQLRNARDELHKTKGDLANEKAAREQAERKAAQALAELQKIAAVTKEARGMVITLSGSVLFASNESTLLPAAIVKLGEVADALTKGNPDSNITVEGHTDSQGQRSYNMDLSKKRADAVREQLVARGVAGDRISSVGIGPDRPIAPNNTADGRANNRRVEIIVQPSGK